SGTSVRTTSFSGFQWMPKNFRSWIPVPRPSITVAPLAPACLAACTTARAIPFFKMVTINLCGLSRLLIFLFLLSAVEEPQGEQGEDWWERRQSSHSEPIQHRIPPLHSGSEPDGGRQKEGDGHRPGGRPAGVKGDGDKILFGSEGHEKGERIPGNDQIPQ